MTELKPRIHDESNGLDYVLVGDYYVPDLKLPEEHRPIENIFNDINQATKRCEIELPHRFKKRISMG